MPVVITAAALTAALAQLPDKAVAIVEALLNMEISLVDDATTSSAPAVAEMLRPAGLYAAEQVTAATVVRAANRRSLPVVTSRRPPARVAGEALSPMDRARA
ncbi:hypothetical protein ACTWPT_10380 [Nonomuraea sp. 3N208]|uniref:hypothetical protein n=1 Tax=Nonomuraea sp. 3N208 TaxID=3457421 RepID=UPI003FCCA00D